MRERQRFCHVCGVAHAICWRMAHGEARTRPCREHGLMSVPRGAATPAHAGAAIAPCCRAIRSILTRTPLFSHINNGSSID